MFDDIKDFMNAQIGEIKKHKWIESEKAGKDLGDEAVKDWISKYSVSFKETWRKRQSKNI